MQIREIHPSETDFLKEMLYEALYVREEQAPFPKTIVDTAPLLKYVAHWGTQEHDLALVALHKEALVGAIWGRILKPPQTGYGFVNHTTPEITMAIKADYRNQGLGSQLIEELEQHYLKKGISTLSLSVDKQNTARMFYEQKGYRFFAEAGTAVTLLKTL